MLSQRIVSLGKVSKCLHERQRSTCTIHSFSLSSRPITAGFPSLYNRPYERGSTTKFGQFHEGFKSSLAGEFPVWTSQRFYSSSSSLANSNNKNNSDYHCHSAYLARMMIPSDANVAGNVHGGTIMQLIEESAGVAANRYFNQTTRKNSRRNSNTTTSTSSSSTFFQQQQQQRVCAMTSRVEQITFQHPVHVGDVAKVHAQVIFASLHTVAVAVQVTAERMAWSSYQSSSPPDNNNNTNSNSEDTVCNQALLWLVGVVLPDQKLSVHQLNPKSYARALAPQFPIPDANTNPQAYKAYQLAAQAYENRKFADKRVPGSSFDEDPIGLTSHHENGTILDTNTNTNTSSTTTCFTPDYSAVELVQVMLPSDCTTDTGLVGGGVVMKLMDNAAGVAAVRHCGTNAVTVSVDSVNLKSPVLLGDILRVRARPTFTSAKSIEIQVTVVAERFSKTRTVPSHDTKNSENDCNNEDDLLVRREIVTTEQAYFTFVSLPLERNRKQESSSSESLSSSSSSSSSSPTLPMRPLILQSAFDKEQFELGRQRYERRQALRQNRIPKKANTHPEESKN